MSVQELKKYILKSKYARYNKEAQRRETYVEAVNRVRRMMLEVYPQTTDLVNFAYDEMERENVLGSQRALQYGGTPILRKNERIYNCTGSYADRLRFFQEVFFLLLCGCGCGFSVQKHHVDKIPEFAEHRIFDQNRPKRTFVSPDTIEGWADCLGVLISSYFAGKVPFPQYANCDVVFDLSLIRPEGASLSSGAGLAPGPNPLRRSIEIIRNLLDRCIKDGQQKLRPIDVYDIVMHASDAVLAGGVRRSATICIFSPDDLEMMYAKTGNWFVEHPQRGRSNNSVLLVRSKTEFIDFRNLMVRTKECGDPGILWADDEQFLPNPCATPDTLLSTEDGLYRLGDLAASGKPIRVLSDNRIGKGNIIEKEKLGVDLHEATPIVLTQKQAEIYEVITEHGHCIKVTNTHEFPTLRGRLKLKDMKEGDIIFLPSGEGVFGKNGTYEDGLVIGLITGDGTFTDKEAFVDIWSDDFDYLDQIGTIINHIMKDFPNRSQEGTSWKDIKWMNCKVHEGGHPKKRMGGQRLFRYLREILYIDNPKSIKKNVPDCIFHGSKQMIRGYLQGLFFTEGTVNLSGHKRKPTFSVRFSQSNKEFLREVQILLNQFGIVSRLTPRQKERDTLLPDGKGGKKLYHTKQSYELILSRPNGIAFFDKIGTFGRKSRILETMIEYCGRDCNKPERYISKIKSISPFGVSDVYCLTQFDTNTIIVNGCVTGQCAEIGFYPQLQLTEEYEEVRSELIKNYDGPIYHDETSGTEAVSGWQFCVGGNTRLITKSGITTIANAVGKTIEIWNGDEWCAVEPYETGQGQLLYRIEFDDGSYLDTTDNHRFLVADRTQPEYREMQTKDLMRNSQYPLHPPRANVVYEDCGGENVEDAYDYGFLMGICCKKYRFEGASEEKLKLIREDTFAEDIFGWDYTSIINFISGWADSRGERDENECIILGSQRAIRGLQLLLTKVGIVSKIDVYSEAGEITLHGCVPNEVWYTKIYNPIKLNCKILGRMEGKESSTRHKYQVIKSVTLLPGTHTTYCLTEPKNGKCLFNNVITLQCNLSTINGNNVKTEEDFYKMCEASAIIGTHQAGFTHFPYLGRITEEIIRREALLGVSITSIMSNPHILLNPEVLRNGAKIVLDTNEKVAKLININPCARGTCIKPEGTGTPMLGSLGCGVHAWPFKRGIRHVQANVNEVIYQHFKAFNSQACERSVWCQNGTTDVIAFPIEAPPTAKCEYEFTAIEFLSIVKMVYENWVVAGKRPERCTQPWLNHNVSNTVKFRPEEWEDVIKYIYDNRTSFAGITLLPYTGDKDYPQAPHVSVLTMDEIKEKYGEWKVELASDLLSEGLSLFQGDVFTACNAILGNPDDLLTREQEEWVNIIHICLANNIGDKKATYLLKDLYNYKKFHFLKENFREVDYESLIEEQDLTQPMQEVACSGGVCTL